MRIVLDARMLYWTGVGRYTKALLDNLETLDRDNHYIVLMRRADWHLWEPAADNFEKVEANFNPYTLGEQLGLVRLIKKLKPDLVHFTAPNSPILYHGRKVVTIHDLTLLDFDTSRGEGLKKRLRGLKRWPFQLVVSRSAASAMQVITATTFVEEQVTKRFGVHSQKVHVIWLGTDRLAAKPESLARFDVGRDFLLYFGNFYPYKNVGSTIAALAALAAAHPHVRLVMAGKPDYFQRQLLEYANKLGVRDRVIFLGFVTDGELVALCRRATLLIVPSLSEGFGLPGLEAMAEGLPVLAAKASCLPEVYADAAEYFDPHDVADQARKIAALLNDPKRRQELSRAGLARVNHFSWSRMAKQTFEVYREAVKN